MATIKLKIQCKSCGGSGVYQGMGERDGAAVICHTCGGTGCERYEFSYNLFKSRKKTRTVKRVYLSGYGYCIAPKILTLNSYPGPGHTRGPTIDFTKEGVSYKEFLSGKMPKHIHAMACPMMADQDACHKIEGFTDECNRLNVEYLNHIPSCKWHNSCAACWERFEKGGDINGKRKRA